MRNFLLTLTTTALIAFPAGADPSQQEVDTARSECRDAFLARDAEAYMDAAASMIAWGSLQNADWSREVELCLAFAEAIEGASLDTARERAAGLSDAVGPTPAPSEEPAAPQADAPAADTRLADFLSRIQADGADVEAIVREIAADTTFAPSPGPERDALEEALNAYVRPIPAAQAERNFVAYQALARVNGENQTYVDKAASYEQAIEAEREQLQRTARALEGRLVRTTAEFDGSSWGRHPSSPRFQDIRNYVTLYLIESGSGQKTMELFFHYTSRSGWLFVESPRSTSTEKRPEYRLVNGFATMTPRFGSSPACEATPPWRLPAKSLTRIAPSFASMGSNSMMITSCQTGTSVSSEKCWQCGK